MNSSGMLQDLQKSIARQKQLQSKAEPVTPLSIPALQGWELLRELDLCKWHERVAPSQPLGWSPPPTQKMESKMCLFQYLAFFPPFKIFASADSGLTGCGSTRVFRVAASAQGNGDFQ